MRFGRCGEPPGRRLRHAGALLAAALLAAACAAAPMRVEQPGRRHSTGPNRPSAAAIGRDPVTPAPRLEAPTRRRGVIAGQVLDHSGRPFAGATVDALATRTEQGQIRMFPVASATTDDGGEFRLTDLAAGEYHLSAPPAAAPEAVARPTSSR